MQLCSFEWVVFSVQLKYYWMYTQLLESYILYKESTYRDLSESDRFVHLFQLDTIFSYLELNTFQTHSYFHLLLFGKIPQWLRINDSILKYPQKSQTFQPPFPTASFLVEAKAATA